MDQELSTLVCLHRVTLVVLEGIKIILWDNPHSYFTSTTRCH